MTYFNLVLSSILLFVAINCDTTFTQAFTYSAALLNFGLFLESLKNDKSS